MEDNLVLTTEEAAEFLKLTPFTVRDYARRGILPSRKVGKAWRFYKPDLLAWLRDYKAPPIGGKAMRHCTWKRTTHAENTC
jgi:PTS system nitrogen regulatory IIA component